MRIPLHTRLECPHSYAVDDSMHLMCDFEGCCDGELYDCCLWDKPELGIMAQMVLDEERIADDAT